MMMPWYFGANRPFWNAWSGSWMWGFNIGWFIVPFAVWSLLWTGIAMWYAARRGEKGWFVFFLLFHTLGLVEILYLVFVAHAFGKEQRSRRRR